MRILVLGTSHAATLRRAFPALRAAHPALELSFWGLPGGAFQKACLGPDGRVTPDPTDALGLRKAQEWNGEASIDLRPFDRIFLVGLRYGLGTVLQLMRDLQPLDWGGRRQAQGVSERFLRDAIEAEIAAGLTAQIARIPPDDRFVFMPAPYPGEGAAEKGGEALTRAVTRLPDAARLMAMTEAALAGAHATAGLTLVAQPRETLAGPFLTQGRYVEDPAKDQRHMSAAYGQIAFEALLAAPLDARTAPVAARA